MNSVIPDNQRKQVDDWINVRFLFCVTRFHGRSVECEDANNRIWRDVEGDGHILDLSVFLEKPMNIPNREKFSRTDVRD
jgi:hypothetical protein